MRLITPKRLKQNEDFMWRLADRQLDEFLDDGRCEFISAYSQPFAMLAVADLLGVPESEHQRFREGFGLSASPVDSVAPRARAQRTRLARRLFRELRRGPPPPAAQGCPHRPRSRHVSDGSTPDVTAVVRTRPSSSPPGQETTARLLATAMRYLCEHPQLQGELREHRERIPDFIEETLRIESPVKADFVWPDERRPWVASRSDPARP